MVPVNWLQELDLLTSDAESGNGMNKTVSLALKTMFSTSTESAFQSVTNVKLTMTSEDVFHAMLDTNSPRDPVSFLCPIVTLPPTLAVKFGRTADVLNAHNGTSVVTDSAFQLATSAKLSIQ